LLREQNDLRLATQEVRRETRQFFLLEHSEHDRFIDLLKRKAPAVVTKQDEQLLLAEKQLRILDPAEVLKRGYSYTLHNGEIVTNAAALKPGDTISTVFHNGSASSTINETHHG
jgi:exodeoxyribonuclease VII large subunit